MLDQDASKPFERPEHGAVKHHGCHFVGMLVDVECAKPAGQVEVNLHCSALPVAADCVAQNVLELGSIESAFAFVECPWAPGCLEGGHQCRFRLVPNGILADAFVWPVREIDPHVGEPEILVY